MLMQEFKVPFDQARELTKAGAIFTVHTPVPAGIDYYPSDMIGRYFGHLYQELGLNHEQFMALGRQKPERPL